MRPRRSLLWIAVAAAASALAGDVPFPRISVQPFNASQVLDPRLASFSFELAYIDSFTGNVSNPNELTQQLMQRLVERTGVGPDIRPGGITVSVTPSSNTEKS